MSIKMNCYICQELPNYTCNCTSPPTLVCSIDLNTHLADKTKSHPLKSMENPRQVIRRFMIKKQLQKLSQAIISDIESKILELKKNLQAIQKNILQQSIRIANELSDEITESEIINQLKPALGNYYNLACDCLNVENVSISNQVFPRNIENVEAVPLRTNNYVQQYNNPRINTHSGYNYNPPFIPGMMQVGGNNTGINQGPGNQYSNYTPINPNGMNFGGPYLSGQFSDLGRPSSGIQPGWNNLSMQSNLLMQNNPNFNVQNSGLGNRGNLSGQLGRGLPQYNPGYPRQGGYNN